MAHSVRLSEDTQTALRARRWGPGWADKAQGLWSSHWSEDESPGPSEVRAELSQDRVAKPGEDSGAKTGDPLPLDLRLQGVR